MFLRPNNSIAFIIGHTWSPELEKRKILHSVPARSHSLEGMCLFDTMTDLKFLSFLICLFIYLIFGILLDVYLLTCVYVYGVHMSKVGIRVYLTNCSLLYVCKHTCIICIYLYIPTYMSIYLCVYLRHVLLLHPKLDALSRLAAY